MLTMLKIRKFKFTKQFSARNNSERKFKRNLKSLSKLSRLHPRRKKLNILRKRIKPRKINMKKDTNANEKTKTQTIQRKLKPTRQNL